jgi:hypothetical protein
VDRERRRSTVDHSHRLEGGWPERRPRAWNLNTVEGKGRGDGGEPHRLQDGAVEGRTRPGDGGEQSAEGWTLRTRKRAIEGGVSVVMAGGCSSPFIVAGEGHTGRGRGKQPAVIVLTPLMAGRLDEGLRGGIKAWSEDLNWHLKVGGRVVWGGRRR